ncbi:RcnB family protein [Sphingomonas montana]|uniref:RcnB family protein n=1 Tax=Sphingomonas montana TaxID=1843236 RepID=UPI0009F98538|nr:RcnB family protein [Sphingomonas montana]
MHKMLTALLLGATMAAPVLAQQDRGPARARSEGDRGPRGDRPERMDRRAAAPAPDMPVRAEPPGQFDEVEQVGQRPDRDGRHRDRLSNRRDDRFDDRIQGGPGRGNPDRGYFGRDGFDRNGPDRRGPDRDGRYDGPRNGRFDGRDPRGLQPGRGNEAYGRNAYRWQGGSGTWNRDWRNDGRYDWQSYRRGNDRAFRAPRYYGPPGLGGNGYRRWSPGYRIQPAFYGRNYWISRPELYRLPPAYGGYRWVRYYDDVALVDIRSGLIADILYSFFL